MRHLTALVVAAAVLPALFLARVAPAALRAGAYVADVTPQKWPVIINGNFNPVIAQQATSPVRARCLVLDDGKTKMAMVVVDSCMMPADIVQAVKRGASQSTGIPVDKMMISATHTHSAPSLMGLLGVEEDPEYRKFFVPRVVEGIERAAKNLVPVKVGWTVVQDWEHTHCRQWVFRPDRMLTDPFGGQTVRVNMHPGYQNASTIGPSAPVDPDLSILSFQTPDGKPVALFANYSMHYYGAPAVSADWSGLFCDKLEKMIAGDAPKNGAAGGFMAAMSQGTSGDLMWPNYGKPADPRANMDAYSEAVAKVAHEAYQKIRYRDDADLAMAEADLHLRVREPDAQRLAWAKDVLSKLNGRPPQSLPEVYAREAVLLHEKPERDVKLQAIRVGDLGFTAIPHEVFAITGLKIKAQSPLAHTVNIELANDAVGYIPPPEFHPLGGYTTWPARSAALEVGAEPKIVDALLGLLEQVSGKPRKKVTDTHGAYAQAVLAAKPLAYWRLNESAGQQATDATGNNRHGTHETGVLFYLEGPDSPAFSGENTINRAAHYAGGRTKIDLKDLGPTYSVELWFWNGLANEARSVTAYLVSRGADGDNEAAGDHLGIGGTFAAQGKLLFFNGNKRGTILSGNTVIEPKTWNHVVYVRDGKKATAYLNGNPQPELSGEAEVGHDEYVMALYAGGRNDNRFNLEGRLDEVAVYDRALSGEEAAAHFKASGLPPKANTPGPQVEGPKSPEEALKLLHVKPGFVVEQVAAEPDVIDPVALAWGPDGKLWVAEMADYPYGVDGKMKAGSRIRFLEDADGDAKYERSVVFMEGVNFPTGVLPWRKGVVVTAAPDIFYAEDTDGDGKADKREVLYTGFTEGNPQLRVNGLQPGLDNWIYCANGWSSQGEVVAARTGKKVNVGGRDIRLRIDEGDIDTDTGMSEFGRNRDDWGEWFGCNNSEPLWHYVLSDRYTRRNPYVAPPDLRYQLARPNNPKVYPLSRPEKRYHSFEQAGHFTSACATMFYRDELLFDRGGGVHHSFVCEPVHNLVQHMVVTDDGVSFKAGRAADEPDRDFLASEDSWFRPVFLATGPDGALWVADMYRQMIEHPDWLPEEGKRDWEPNYRKGEDKGRIYRIFPKGKRPRAIPRLDKLSTPELVGALDSPNGWQRDTAQMMLVWRKDPAAVAPLKALAVEGKSPFARAHAMCTLDGLEALDADLIARSMKDQHPGVRRQAVRLAESRAKDAPPLVEAAVALADDPDARVRLQLACALGEWNDPRAGAALAKLAVKDAGDTYIAAAVMGSATAHYEALANAMLESGGPVGGPMYRNLLAMSLALNNRDLTARLMRPVVTRDAGGATAEQMAAFGQFLDVLALAKSSVDQLAAGAKDALADQLAGSAPIFDDARRVVADASQPAEARIAATRVLGRQAAAVDADLNLLAALLTPQSPPELQQAAVAAAGRVDSPKVPELFVAGWASHSPGVRLAVAELLLTKEPWSMALLDAIESRRVARADLDLTRQQRLLNHPSAAVKERAGRLLGGSGETATAANRQKAIDRYVAVLTAQGDAARGAVVFTKNCAVCHRFDEAGNEIGPNLRQVSGWTPDQLIAAVLDPNRQVEPRYLSYTAKLKDGNAVFGIITGETGNSITMKGVDGKAHTILRGDLTGLESTNRSLMPDGFEAAIKQKDMADLIAYLRSPPGR